MEGVHRFKQTMQRLYRREQDVGWNPIQWLAVYAISSTKDAASCPPSTQPFAEIECYRGVTGYHDNPSLGELVCFNQLGSTSTDENVAKDFTKDNGTLYEMDRIPAYALGIEGYSYIPTEKEVLVLPSSVFKVVSVKKEKGVNITRVKLANIQ